MMDSSRVPLNPDERGLGDAPGKSQGKLALALGVIAIALSMVLGFVSLRSARRLEREVARLSQQTAGRAGTGAIADVGSAGFASGCERAGSRSTARLGEAGSIGLGGAGATCAAAGRRRAAKGRSSHTAG